MSSLALNLTQWTAISAIGTLALALATTTAIIVGLVTVRGDRKRDDAKRQQDRDWDTARRKEDRDRDDQLRREDRDELERRYRAEQRDREDYEARQVTVEIERGKPMFGQAAGDLKQRIIISAPVTYPIKWVGAEIAHLTGGGNLGVLPIGYAGDPAATEGSRVYYRFWADIPDGLYQPAPIVRFTDRHGNLYYAYRQHTWRFGQNTDFITAAAEIDKWIRTGPKPDEPGASA